MKAKVLINNAESEIPVATDETLLESCLRAQIGPSYSCLEGVCGFCEAEIIEGDIRTLAGFEADGHPKIIKTCQAFPVSKAVKIKYLKKT